MQNRGVISKAFSKFIAFLEISILPHMLTLISRDLWKRKILLLTSRTQSTTWASETRRISTTFLVASRTYSWSTRQMVYLKPLNTITTPLLKVFRQTSISPQFQVTSLQVCSNTMFTNWCPTSKWKPKILTCTQYWCLILSSRPSLKMLPKTIKT